MNDKHEINLWKLRTDLDGKCLQNGLVDKGHEKPRTLESQLKLMYLSISCFLSF